MAFNALALLAGKAPDVMGSFTRGMEAGQFANEVRDRNSLRALYAAQGPQIMAGQPQALNALAQINTPLAMDAQGALLNQQQTRQDMAFSAEEMQMRRAQAKAEAEAMIAQNQAALDAAKAEEYQRDMMGILAGGAAAYDAGPEAFNAWAQETGLPLRYEGFRPWAARTAGEIDALDEYMKVAPKATERTKPQIGTLPEGTMVRDPYNPQIEQVPGYTPPPPKVEAPTFRAATPEEAAQYGAQAGQIDTKTGRFYPNNPPSNTVFEQLPGGGMRMVQGPGAVAGAGPTAGAAIRADMTAPSNVLSLIDQIKNDPSLARVVGPLEGGGGNNVDDLGAMARAWYGEGGLGVIQKIAQLQGNAWLAAREMLKGGGQITDYESRKAEGAVARLSRAQGEPQFRAALTDLEDAIREGMKKLEAAQATGATSPAPAAAGSGSQPGAEAPLSQERMDELLRKYGGP